jgi:hypothetical protein
MKQCYCGCGTEAELENFDEAKSRPIDGNKYDQLWLCPRDQIIPKSHMMFEFDKVESGNGVTIYNRYGDIIYYGPFSSEPCPCLGKRVPI